MIKKTMTLALMAGAASLTFSAPAFADGLGGLEKPLVDSSAVAKDVVRKPDVAVDAVIGAVGKVAENGELSNG
ncbi:hypothetical protein ACFWIB_37490 [Streptomyces sp. NPDC127051]|uniref:hypothetical protein n=1 Tax=Streptomyces sp. NPDC127051 TaxID=3347119 RepID=UPI00365DAABB